MSVFKRILCPVDFSPGSEHALAGAVKLAREHSAELIVAHAWHVPAMAMAAETGAVAGLPEQVAADAERALDEAVARARSQGAPSVSGRLLNGVPWHQLVSVLEREHFDLVVIGTHGRTGLARFLLGSVAEKVVRHAPCPVLTLRANADVAAFRDVLCPIDFSQSSRDAAHLAARLVRPGGRGLTLLHVLELPVVFAGELSYDTVSKALDTHTSTVLDQLAEELRALTPQPVHIRTRVGNPGAETIAVTDAETTFDLIVMGSHGRTGITRVLLGSVAERVVRHARCPVLVTHKPAA